MKAWWWLFHIPPLGNFNWQCCDFQILLQIHASKVSTIYLIPSYSNLNMPINFPSYTYTAINCRVGWGKMSMVGQSRSLENFICMPKIREPIVIRSTFLFSDWNRESKTDDPVIISSFALNSETKVSSPPFCLTLPYLPFGHTMCLVGNNSNHFFLVHLRF